MRGLSAGVWMIASGCSFFGLEDFEWPQGEAGCEMLNARDAIADDACELWQPRGPRQDCSFGPRDFDGDGVAPPECGGDDCDDRAPTAFPGGAEICNAVDDDCNGLVDDVRAAPEPSIPIVASLGAPDFVRYGEAEVGAGVVWGKAGEPPRFEIVSSTAQLTLGRSLGSRTNANPVEADTDATLAEGCAERIVVPNELPACGPGDLCPGTQECVTAPGGERICEPPVVARMPDMLPGDCTTHVGCSDGNYCNGLDLCEPNSPASDARGCRPSPSGDPCQVALRQRCSTSLNACVEYSTSSCAVADIALGSAGGEWIATPITSDAMCEGRVRTAYFEDREALPAERMPGRFLTMRGDERFSTSWLGVDLGESACTGASRAEGAPRGAAGIAIATLPADAGVDRRRVQGLATWLAAPVCRGIGACPASAGAEVEAIALWFEEGGAGGTPIAWVNASGSGRPAIAGTSTSSRVHVAAYGSGARAGFVLAWAAADGAHARLVPAMTDPSPICGVAGETLPCIDPVAPYNTAIDAGTDRATPDLVLGADVALGGSPAGDVAIAAGIARPEGIDLVLAWAEAGAVVVARARLDAAAGTIAPRDTPMRIDAASASSVGVVHVDRGFARAGATIGGERVGEDEQGGFVVAWSDGGATRAIRIADALDAPIAMGAFSLGPPASSLHGFVDRDGRARLIGRTGDSLVVFPSICGE
jgi:hypothetical protein